MRVLYILMISIISTNLIGDPKADEKISENKDQTKIDLDQMDVTGQQKSPESAMIDQKSFSSSDALINPRKNWRPEILQTAHELTD